MMTRVRTHGRAHKLAAAIVLLAVFAIASGTADATAFARGLQRTSPVTLTDPNNWQTILTITIAASAHRHSCQAVGSLDAINPGSDATTQYYFFTITVDNANPVLGTNGVQRTIEMRNQGGVNDPDFWPVSTNTLIELSANATHTLRLLGRRAFGAPNLVVDDAVLSIVCV